LESFWLSAAELLVGPGFWGLARFGIKFVKIYRACIPVRCYGGFGGLSPSKERTKHHKLKFETLCISGVFVKFSMSIPPAHR